MWLSGKRNLVGLRRPSHASAAGWSKRGKSRTRRSQVVIANRRVVRELFLETNLRSAYAMFTSDKDSKMHGSIGSIAIADSEFWHCGKNGWAGRKHVYSMMEFECTCCGSFPDCAPSLAVNGILRCAPCIQTPQKSQQMHAGDRVRLACVFYTPVPMHHWLHLVQWLTEDLTPRHSGCPLSTAGVCRKTQSLAWPGRSDASCEGEYCYQPGDCRLRRVLCAVASSTAGSAAHGALTAC